MKHVFLPLIFIFTFSLPAIAQPDRWQQHVDYKMDVDVDVLTNKFTGMQKLEYTNNSPDQLDRVFFHLYWNAFRPGSEMDVRSRELGKVLVNNNPQWDSRVTDRISKLQPSEIGYQKIISLKMNGVEQKIKLHGTILEVNLTKPIAPNSKVSFDIQFEAQVPKQIRRSGRDNAEGVRYSMSQWYPKICEYDYEGWHPTPYVGREFYGVWGDFDVTIKIDKSYKLAGTGLLVNAGEIGWGYDKPGTSFKNISTPKRTWHFEGKNIHDFVWAADPEYDHIVRKVNGITVHTVFKKVDSLRKQWESVADAAVMVLPFIEKKFGKYPYPQYSFIEGGDGGMEYPMATLMNRPSIGTAFHEWLHSWYQMMLGTNESLYPWMDEGFTNYAEEEVKAYYYQQMKVPPKEIVPLPENHADAYKSYFRLGELNLEEPLTTHADHYATSTAYSVNAYSKGEIFLNQLGYIVSDKVRDKILLEYYRLWRFKHPNPTDFIKVAQDVGGMQLDWYKEYWINTTKSIDYAIDSLWQEGELLKIRVRRIGEMPMPLDLRLTFRDSTQEDHYIPLDLMFGTKPQEDSVHRITNDEWPWTNPTYIIESRHPITDIKIVEIDPTWRMADIDRNNNKLTLRW
jgi:hypothetical protein